jgi:hypothetical protein
VHASVGRQIGIRDIVTRMRRVKHRSAAITNQRNDAWVSDCNGSRLIGSALRTIGVSNWLHGVNVTTGQACAVVKRTTYEGIAMPGDQIALPERVGTVQTPIADALSRRPRSEWPFK